jgi:hypothetical protein
MRGLTCRGVGRRLSAFHDGELGLGDRLAVRVHLETCRACAVKLQRFHELGEELRGLVPVARLSVEQAVSLKELVIGQVQAERDESVGARFGRMFEDMHLVWAGVGATFASVACSVIMLGLLQFAGPERGDSLAGILSALTYPEIQLPRVVDTAMPTILVTETPGDDELVFALSGIVTREGRLTDVEMLSATEHAVPAVPGVLDDVSSARFEPARFDGAPVAVSMIWLLARTEVRGS